MNSVTRQCALEEAEDKDPLEPEKPLDFGDPLAGVELEEELADAEGDGRGPANDAFGGHLGEELLDTALETDLESVVLLDVGGLVPSLPALVAELEGVVSDVPASAFLQDDWSRLGDEIGPDDPSEGSVMGSMVPFGAAEAFEDLGDAGEDGPAAEREAWPLELGALDLDDVEPALSSSAWNAARVSDADIQALLLADGHLLAAGDALVSVPRAAAFGAARGELRTVKPPHPLVSVAPWQEPRLLCASAVGALYRYSVERGFELESELHRRLGLPLDAPIGWKLAAHRFGAGRVSVVALCSNGRVLLSDAEGRLRSQLGRGLGLGAGSPLSLIHRHDGGLGLRRLEDPTGRWRECALGSSAGMRIDERTELCCHGELVAVAHPESGVWVSLDDGLSFLRVAGSSNVTAIHFGELDGRAVLFLAIATAAPAVRIVLCDPASRELECIAEIEPGALSIESTASTSTLHASGVEAGSDGTFARGEERDEWTARVLLWDAQSRMLWVGGGLGLVQLTPR